MRGLRTGLLTFLASVSAVTFLAKPADASVIINVTEVAGTVLFEATGSLDLTGAAFIESFGAYDEGFIPGGSNWWVGPGSGGATDTYAFTSFAGPFGTSLTFFNSPLSSTGTNFYIWGNFGGIERVGVPTGYTSGGAINASMTFAGTIAGFTMIPGSYLYTLPNDSITLNIGAAAAVPEPATLLLLGTGLAAAGVRRRMRKRE